MHFPQISKYFAIFLYITNVNFRIHNLHLRNNNNTYVNTLIIELSAKNDDRYQWSGPSILFWPTQFDAAAEADNNRNRIRPNFHIYIIHLPLSA